MPMTSPGLSEIATTTQRNRKMPSHSVKQAKTMSAIAHGWKPKGSAAGIPVKVAKEFHAADKGKKYGKGHDKGHAHEEHRQPHHSVHVGNNDGFAGKLESHFTGKGHEHDLAHHKKQPHGRKGKEMVGFAETRHHGGHDSFHAEQEEHWGKKRGGVAHGTGPQRPHGHGDVVGHVRHHNADHDQAHSKLVGQAGMGHKKQPHRGDSTGAGRTAVAEHHVGHVMKQEHSSHNAVTHEPLTAHVFRNPMGGDSHGYGHSSYQRHGFHRHSGHPGGHRIGHRSK